MIDKGFRVRHSSPNDEQGDTLPPSILYEDGIPQYNNGEREASLLWSYNRVREATVTCRARVEILRAKLEDVTDALNHEGQALRVNEAMLARIQRELAAANIDTAGRRIDEHSSSN
jgi:hypothetical protein